MVQWIRIRLPIQGTWVRSLVREDSTCHRATKPAATLLKSASLEPRALQQEKPLQGEARCCNEE